jgi:hypothetical protein
MQIQPQRNNTPSDDTSFWEIDNASDT